MKAITQSTYGGPDVLQLRQVEKPTPQENEILVKVQATVVGYGDLLARRFNTVTQKEFNMPGLMLLPAKMAFGLSKPNKAVLGSEFAGVVEAVGSAVTRFKPGDRLFGYLGDKFGANAEYLCMSETGTVTHMPANMTFEEATTLPYGAVTALNLLKKANIQPGQKVLINGASGSIGSAAVQLARHYGAEVTGVCGTPRVDYVKALGADKVIDYRKEDFTKNGEAYDMILDILGKLSFERCKDSLTPHGRLLYASFKMPKLLQMLATARSDGKKVICALSFDKQDDIVQIRKLAETGVFKPVIDRTFPLADMAVAHRYVEAGQKKGSVIIQVAS